MKTKTEIRRCIKENPLLNDYGMGSPPWIPFPLRLRQIKEDQKRLIDNEKKFELACKLLSGIDKTESIDTSGHSSYFIKHIFERRLECGHLSNGTLIAAALNTGFLIKRIGSSPNVQLNISKETLQHLYNESLLYQKYPNHHLINGEQMN